ncbi:MAG: hypothetical protein JRF56_13380, partial [Deltaproteobacteria bacterium]|nr:hypothetical protein [Deltaproteobacteria bacterium]
MKKENCDNQIAPRFSRREFIKNSLLTAGAASALSAVSAVPVQAATASGKLPLIVSGYKLDRTEALIDGRATVEGCEIKFEPMGIGDINTNVFSGPQTLDVTEIGLHPFMLAYANEDFRDYSLLPIFPLRLFRHKSIFIRTDRGIKGPEDLRGKKVATPGFSSTSLTWLRGIVKHEYGV